MAAANTPTLQDVVSDDLNYEIWAPIVKASLVEKGLWDVVENGVPPDPSKVPELAATIQGEDLSNWRDFVGKDTKALQILQSSLPDSVFRKTLEAASAKDLWDLLKESNEQASLEKEFERLGMEKREGVSSYVNRVAEIAIVPRFADAKSKFHSAARLISLSDSYDGAAPVMEQLTGPQNLTFNSLRVLLDTFESVPVETFYEYLKVLEVGSSSDHEAITKMLTSLSDSYDGAAPVMKKNPRLTFDNTRKLLGLFESVPAEAICRMLKRLEAGSSSSSQSEEENQSRDGEVLPEYQMFAFDMTPRTYDEDMWMIYSTTSNHMSPYEKYFTTLDRTHKARIKFITGDAIMSEGIGDVVIMTDKGKKTIKNVLFVPKIDRNVLSVGQLTQKGYGIVMSVDKYTIKDQNGRLFGEAMWEERGYFLRLEVVEGNLTT